MGIYDREYYRREGPSFLSALADRGQMCKWLVAINVVLFVLQILAQQGAFGSYEMGTRKGDPVTDALDLNTASVLQGQVWRLVTYAFLHGGIWHILFNMLFLWWFGHEMEEMYGKWEFLTFYLTSAVLGGVAYVLTQAAGIGGDEPCIGASGAVTAVMVLFAFHFPRRVILLFFFLPVPIWAFVAFQVARDALGFVSGVQNGVATAVHLGGAVCGFAYYKSQVRLLSLLPSLQSLRGPRSRPRLRVYHEEDEVPTPVKAAAPSRAADVDEHLEARMDAVLQKVADFGLNSLTENEREILLRASEAIKRRRK
ncbi:MAG TPA: rhomboid family intramembrane serine protease [Gemmataceae bacterium]|nr:rhomboid family intramembrane serine protease [Gemmataceae bacterium]